MPFYTFTREKGGGVRSDRKRMYHLVTFDGERRNLTVDREILCLINNVMVFFTVGNFDFIKKKNSTEWKLAAVRQSRMNFVFQLLARCSRLNDTKDSPRFQMYLIFPVKPVARTFYNRLFKIPIKIGIYSSPYNFNKNISIITRRLISSKLSNLSIVYILLILLWILTGLISVPSLHRWIIERTHPYNTSL